MFGAYVILGDVLYLHTFLGVVMLSVYGDNLWEKLDSLERNSQSKIAAVSYITDDSVISFYADDVLVVDASDQAISMGKTSAKIIKKYFDADVKIYSNESLHAKVIVFDASVYIGSANISINSQKNLNEFGLISDIPSVVADSMSFIDLLSKKSILITENHIDHMMKIEVIKQPNNRGKKRKVNFKKSQSWLISIRDDAKYPNDYDEADDSNRLITDDSDNRDWFWLRKSGKMFSNANAGDSVIVLYRKSIESTNAEHVYKPAIIREITEEENGVKIIHYIKTGKPLSWEKFVALAKQEGIHGLGRGVGVERLLPREKSDSLFMHWNK